MPIITRPEPPSELTPDQAEVWRSVVATKPADWFTRDYQPLLVQYCRHKTRAAQVARMIEEAPENGGDLRELFAMEREQSAMLSTLATKMRLTPQSRWQPATAASRANQAAQTAKPWEFAKVGS